MELEELKRSWELYDKKLTESLKLNEELLRRSNLDRSRREMNTPLALVTFDTICALIFAVFFLAATLRYGNEWRYLLTGGFSTLFMLTLLFLDIKMLGMLRRIDYYNTSVLSLQKQLSSFQKMFNNYKRTGLYLLPLAIISIFPIIVKILNGHDAMDYPGSLIFNYLIILGISYPLLIWIFRHFFEKKIKAAKQFLSELKEFEKE